MCQWNEDFRFLMAKCPVQYLDIDRCQRSVYQEINKVAGNSGYRIDFPWPIESGGEANRKTKFLKASMGCELCTQRQDSQPGDSSSGSCASLSVPDNEAWPHDRQPSWSYYEDKKAAKKSKAVASTSPAPSQVSCSLGLKDANPETSCDSVLKPTQSDRADASEDMETSGTKLLCKKYVDDYSAAFNRKAISYEQLQGLGHQLLFIDGAEEFDEEAANALQAACDHTMDRLHDLLGSTKSEIRKADRQFDSRMTSIKTQTTTSFDTIISQLNNEFKKIQTTRAQRVRESEEQIETINVQMTAIRKTIEQSDLDMETAFEKVKSVDTYMATFMSAHFKK